MRAPDKAAIIRLLILTGCRKSEVLELEWRDYREGKLYLPDSKAGPRQVLLNSEAMAVIARQARVASVHVFPSPVDMNRARNGAGLHAFWCKVRDRAGLQDVRLHDLRHRVASQAVLAGVPLSVVSKLLGHSQASMPLRYAHVHDAETQAAPERVGNVIAGICGFPQQAAAELFGDRVDRPDAGDMGHVGRAAAGSRRELGPGSLRILRL